MTRALLPADPRRLRVLGAQPPASLGQGAGAGVTAAPLADATQAVPGRHGLPAAAIARAAAGTTTAAALSGPLGAAAGITLRNPALAACVIVPWSHLAEPFISTLPYHTYTYLPGGARESLTHHHPAHHHIPPPAGGLIPAGWAAATALTAAPAFTRHDAHSGPPPQARPPTARTPPRCAPIPRPNRRNQTPPTTGNHRRGAPQPARQFKRHTTGHPAPASHT